MTSLECIQNCLNIEIGNRRLRNGKKKHNKTVIIITKISRKKDKRSLFTKYVTLIPFPPILNPLNCRIH